ncbi:uncharacterized protein VTP21DRAFT_9416 [Calcarisporiella thermophila]|uniref:uncharacterized protein n=1 Tax=Calcarisporiella thermophila TaxID=911321 RepID=UPI0037431BCD
MLRNHSITRLLREVQSTRRLSCHRCDPQRASIRFIRTFRPLRIDGKAARAISSSSQKNSTIAATVSTLDPASSKDSTSTPSTSNQPFSHHPPCDYAPADTRWKAVDTLQLSALPGIYKELTKAQLAGLVVLTTMCGYAMAPGATSLSCLLWTTLGTGMCVASANSINQWIEAPYDAQMKRTRNRVLVRRAIQPAHAFAFGSAAGIAGVTMLASCVNGVTAVLGLANILLYTSVYTPLKRVSIANTWAGAVVGAIPPMMGWAACTGGLEPGAWVLGVMLYAWQFPHFNSLSWNLRSDYSKAGYRMMSVTHPGLNARTSLRYSLLLVPLSLSAPLLGMTTPLFAVDSTVVNGALTFLAYRFWRDSNDKNARQLFFGSLLHLPALLALMMIHKKPAESRLEEEFEEEEHEDLL